MVNPNIEYLELSPLMKNVNRILCYRDGFPRNHHDSTYFPIDSNSKSIFRIIAGGFHEKNPVWFMADPC
ncbi:hypothetical protein ATC1_1179 [Flexilinea flocculi]|uniref:Uncharacterized protein n=1 Tax=Flexilinea flocculi TaxID=1678840 RepID=A0A0K8PAJ5_9CHLR|nr:hypothetical protein ATC1_1179 [Flexilinea flocculi]